MSRSFSFGCAGVTGETLHIGPKLGFQGLKIDAKLCETLHLEPPGRQAKYNRRKGSMPVPAHHKLRQCAADTYHAKCGLLAGDRISLPSR
jgi:hypothetical protein